MPWPCGRWACTWGALALLMAALVCLGACVSRQATPPATAGLLPETARPAGATSPASHTVSPTTIPAAEAATLIWIDQGGDQPVWASQGGSAARVVARADAFRLSPDGRSLALIRGFPHELWLAGSDGRGERLLYTALTGGPLIHSPLWAPDGTAIVFSLSCPGCPASQDPGALWRLEVATGAVRQLAGKGAHWPLFSPDSRWLSLASPLGTLVSHGSVGLIDAAEGQGEPALADFVNVWDRAWAADSSGFVVAYADGAAPAGVTELWWIPTGGTPLKLGQVTGVSELMWQPGGQRLVYRKTEGDGTGRLYLAHRDGSQEVRLPGSEGLSLHRGQFSSWSPDGRWLLAMDERGSPYLVDTSALAVHPLDVLEVYGWPGTGRYLAGTIPGELLEAYRRGEDIPVEVYRCAPLGACEWLAQVPRLAHLGYAER